MYEKEITAIYFYFLRQLHNSAPLARQWMRRYNHMEINAP